MAFDTADPQEVFYVATCGRAGGRRGLLGLSTEFFENHHVIVVVGAGFQNRPVDAPLKWIHKL